MLDILLEKDVIRERISTKVNFVTIGTSQYEVANKSTYLDRGFGTYHYAPEKPSASMKPKPVISFSGITTFDNLEGHQFERYCAELLRKLDFSHVEVTKGSGDQGVDIVAVKDKVRYAIQCKCYSSPLGNSPVQEVYAGKQIYHCHVAAVLTNSRFTSGAIELARATGVLLWDRKDLMKMIQDALDRS